MMKLTLEGIGKSYRSHWALSDISLSLDEGEITGLLGSNGAGKSTLLKILSGYFYPSLGTVRLGDRDIFEDGAEWRKMTGFLPEGAPLPPRRTPRELLDEQYRLYHKSPSEEGQIALLANRFGLDGTVLDKSVKSLSRGYRQRTGLALAETGDPYLLLLDEPFSGLDPALVRTLRDALRDKKKDRITLFSSHILQEVYTLCDSIIILHEGVLKGRVKKTDFTRWEELDDLYHGLIGGSHGE